METAISHQQQNPPLPQLIKGQSIYKLIVPQNVEEKIRHLIRKFPHTEWSGVLFYTHQGSFEDNDLIITCQDIFPMDLGTTGWTEFQMSEDVASYMADNIELFDCEIGLVHSHHTMGAFFSGQDIKMIQQEGDDTNCFVSLVVDTKGTYVAIVTRKIQSKSEVTIKNLGKSYEFFGEGSKEITHDDTEVKKFIDKEIIEYFDLEVERHEVPNSLEYLDTRFEEIESKKQTKFKNTLTNENILTPNKSNADNSFFDSKLPLFNENKEVEIPTISKVDWTPDPKKIHAAVVHMLTCSLILNPDKIDLKQWITKHMVNVYKKMFGSNSIHECGNNVLGAYSEWRDFIIQYTLDYFDYSNAPESKSIETKVVEALMEELFEFIDINPYVMDYYNCLFEYITE